VITESLMLKANDAGDI